MFSSEESMHCWRWLINDTHIGKIRISQLEILTAMVIQLAYSWLLETQSSEEMSRYIPWLSGTAALECSNIVVLPAQLQRV
jgi:hypothetical protein